MHNEFAPTGTTESTGTASELTAGVGEAERRRQEQSIGRAAMRAALLDAKPPTPSSNEATIRPPLSDAKRKKFETLVRRQQLISENGKDPNVALLDRAEKVPDAYSAEKMLGAKLKSVLGDAIEILSADSNNSQLIESLKNAFREIETSGASERLQYNPQTKRLTNIAGAEHLSGSTSSSVVNIGNIAPTSQPSASEEVMA